MNNDLQNSQSTAKPSHEQIASRAEVLWKAKGSPSGRDEEIWLEAERQLFDEAREIIGDTPAASPAPSSLSSEEPAMPPQAEEPQRKSRSAETMTSPSPTKPAGGSRRRSSGR